MFQALGQSGRPLLLWIWDENASSEDRAEYETRATGDDDLAILAKGFDCVRLPMSALGEDFLTKALKKGPGFVAFSGDGKMLGRAMGKVKAKAVYTAAARAFEATTRKSAKKVVAEYDALLRKLEQAEDLVALKTAEIKELHGRNEKKPSASNTKRLAELEEQLAQLIVDHASLVASEKEHFQAESSPVATR